MYSSVVWSGIIRCREGQADVAYPTELDDDMFDDDGIKSYGESAVATNAPASLGQDRLSRNPNYGSSSRGSWLTGWNFATDLYRILEHANDRFRTSQARQENETFLNAIFGASDASQGSVLKHVMTLYADLPQSFKKTNPITLNMAQDRFGFQAANITATIQLLRMVLFTSGGASIDSKCQIASEVVNSFLNIPVAYLRAISSPLLHHIGGIGNILGSTFEQPMCEKEYSAVRAVLLSMAQLLANVDTSVGSSQSASERLRSQISRVDEYMASVRREKHPPLRQQSSIGGTEVNGALDAVKNASDDPFRTSIETLFQSTASNHNARPNDPDESVPDFSDFQHQLPAELFEDWPWIFASNFDQTLHNVSGNFNAL